MSKKSEFRDVKDYEIREIQVDDKKKVEIEGYFAKFNNLSELWTGYLETIDSRAFDETISDGHNIMLLYHHDWTKPLASTKTNLLELKVDNIGLKFKATINSNLSYAKDVIELVNDGLIQGCSFGFECIEDEVIYNRESDTLTRTLKKVKLHEGSLLCNPQYDDTTVFTRTKERIDEERQKLEVEKELVELKKDYELNKLI